MCGALLINKLTIRKCTAYTWSESGNPAVLVTGGEASKVDPLRGRRLGTARKKSRKKLEIDSPPLGCFLREKNNLLGQ